MKYHVNYRTVFRCAKKIRILVLDVDGVLTDGKLYYNSNGEEMKAFNSLDGHGIKMMKQAGLEVGIITGRKSSIVARRAKELGITLLYQGREDKVNAINELMQATACQADQIAYAGDDLPDLAVLKMVGLGFSVINAHPAVRSAAKAEPDKPGGSGAVREICDFILHRQGLLKELL